MKKVYSPMREQYLYLYGEVADIKIISDTVKTYKWNIPLQNINDSDLSVQSIVSEEQDVDSPYTIRAQVGTNNVYDAKFKDPILYISHGFNIECVTNPPKLQIKNKVMNTITLEIEKFSVAEAPPNDDFIICLKLVDYIPEDKVTSFTPNPNQRYDVPNYLTTSAK